MDTPGKPGNTADSMQAQPPQLAVKPVPELFEELMKDSVHGENLGSAISRVVELQDRVNAQNDKAIDSLPDFPERLKQFQGKILEKLFASEKKLIGELHQKNLLKTPQVRGEYLTRKNRLMERTATMLKQFPDLKLNATLMSEMAQYLFFFNGILKEHADVARDGKLALEAIESGLPQLMAEIAVLEHEKKQYEESVEKPQNRRIGKIEIYGRQYIVVKVEKLNEKKLQTFRQRLAHAIKLKLPDLQIHLVNGILPQSYIAIELKEKIDTDDPDGVTEYGQIKLVIEGELENLKNARQITKCTQKSEARGPEAVFYEIGEMIDTNIGDVLMKVEDVKKDRDFWKSENIDALMAGIDEAKAADFEVLIPRIIVRRKIKEAAGPHINELETLRQKIGLNQRQKTVAEELRERKKTYIGLTEKVLGIVA